MNAGMEVDPETSAVQADYEPAEPKPIKKLSKDVINQIAAAEIIHRPANAIKELIENSLDAGSTSIRVTLKDGGLKLIQIADNGHGINKADLPLLCTRYATSKLREFSDLQSLVTYGFRGEALASISYVSHVEVVTKTKVDGCGWRAHYKDGELVAAKPGAGADPKPAAANDGTIISAEDLFYNMPLRKRAFKSPSDEYNRVLDVITKYAIHNPHAAWTCKKAGTSMPDITTQPASTTKANIALLYGSPLANELLEIPVTVLKPENKLGAKLRGWVSNANSNWARKGGWILFINHRLVDSSKIKKAIDSLYTAYLPKGSSPWAYLSLEIDPTKVDVNVSPTKSEVHFLNEDEMIEGVVAAVQTALSGANTSRSFKVQTLLPGAPPSLPKDQDRSHSSTSSSAQTTRKSAPNYKVRMDPSNRTLDSMVSVPNPSQLGEYVITHEGGQDGPRPTKRRSTIISGDGGVDEPLVLDEGEEEEGEGQPGDDDREGVYLPLTGDGTSGTWDTGSSGRRAGKGDREIPESECDFTSIIELRQEAKRGSSADLAEIITKHAFVGIVDRHLCLSLIQHSTKLFLVNHAALADEHFYQLGLRQFGAFNRLRLEPAPPLKELLTLAAEDEPGIQENRLDVKKVVQTITSLLIDKRDMLDEYFSLKISEAGEVESLPMVLKGYTPDLDRLPHFLLCLGTRVDWEDEKECFETFLRELAFFYSPRPFSDASTDPLPNDPNDRYDQGESVGEGERSENNNGATADEINHQLWQLEHVLFPSMRRYTSWPREMGKNGDVRQVANLPDLFRIFERC